MWGGCFCTWFHPRPQGRGLLLDIEAGRPYKEYLVRAGRAHAALVFDGEGSRGLVRSTARPRSCPTSTTARSTTRRQVQPPDYRLTCFFVDRDYRRQGMAARALAGALELIAAAGGGVVEGYPRDTQGQKTSASFLYNSTRSMFEDAGFTYDRAKGTKNCVMRRTVAPA